MLVSYPDERIAIIGRLAFTQFQRLALIAQERQEASP
jgi:hypothetical protein